MVKCDYCGRHGEFGQCEGCGAPHRLPRKRIEVTCYGDMGQRFIVLEDEESRTS